jgi:hypothetical protein
MAQTIAQLKAETATSSTNLRSAATVLHMSDMEFSETVRHLMTRTRESQEVIGTVLGVSRVGVGLRLQGKTRWTLEEVQLLADHWGLHPADLLLGPSHALDRLTQGYDVSAGQDGASSNPAIDDAA